MRCEDPFPQVAGQGAARLRAAGIDVPSCRDGELADAARELNIGFFSRIERGRPWVRLKVAASLDGRSALDNGSSQWITGEAARARRPRLARRAGAVLTGVGTVLDDDPAARRAAGRDGAATAARGRRFAAATRRRRRASSLRPGRC